ncbi:MAG TPA: hypothetical protein VM425_19345 [Myxococcota bacterium]|nr:hypothetical protein [Myxococcota bacterium]
MEVGRKKKLPWGSLRGPQVLILYLIGIIAVFIGERLVGGHGTGRLLTSGLGAAAAVLACLAWIAAWLRSEGVSRRIERLAGLLALGGLAALGLYLLGSDLVMGPSPLGKGDQGVGARQVLGIAWPILMFCTLLPLVFLQVSSASMARGRGLEIGRIRASALSGAVSAAFLCTLFLLNAIADRKDESIDLSYFKTTTPSEASRSMIAGLDTDTRALLFFPAANDVLEQVRPYFKELTGLSSHFSIEIVDRALNPELTGKHHVSSDGTILLVRGESKQKITIGADLERAKRNLRKLDSEFQKAMLKLHRNKDVVYLIRGHGERGPEKSASDVRPGVLVLKKFLMALNMKVENLGPVEGLAGGVPPDAALVIWIDPTAPLFPGEAQAIESYLDQGGRMLITLDVDSGTAAGEILSYLGLTYKPVKLANEKAYVPIDRTPADVYNIVTGSFSSHQSVTTVSRDSRRFPVLFPASGYIEKAKTAAKTRRIVFTVRSLPKTWADTDGDMRRSAQERSAVFNLAAAVSMKIEKKQDGDRDEKAKTSVGDKPAAKKPGEKAVAKKPGKEKALHAEDEMRVVVFSDSDVFADRYLGFRVSFSEIGGNMQLMADVLRWLADEERVPGLPASEEDVKIVHTRDEDVVWFYGTVFAVPLIILLIGFATRWGRGRKKKRVA